MSPGASSSSSSIPNGVPPPAYSAADEIFGALYPKAEKGSKSKKGAELPPPAITVDPSTHLPTTFRIGRKYVTPLITIEGVINHLIFLSCLHKLQEDVRYDGGDAADDDVDGEVWPDVRWAAFCARAAVRFDEWATSTRLLTLVDAAMAAGQTQLNQAQIQEAISDVDIDVLMAWHTYMLNPKMYSDDMNREGGPNGFLRGIKALGAFPLHLIVKNIDLETYVYQRQYTGEEAPPPSYGSHPASLVTIQPMESAVAITCPECSVKFEAPLLGPPTAGSSFVMPDMNIPCPRCSADVTYQKLRVARMLRDLRDVKAGRIQYMAGFGPDETTKPPLSQDSSVYLSRALVKATDKGIYSNFASSPIDVAAIGRVLEWSINNAGLHIVQPALKDKLIGDAQELQLLGPLPRPTYRQIFARAFQRWRRVHGEGFGGLPSLDLGAAIMRQAAFVGNMESLGWLQTSRWTRQDDPNRLFLLQKAVARYHAFLDLMAAYPDNFLSPTLDIDLGWHTHQLEGIRYENETRLYISRFVDHDDKVADIALKAAYDRTAKLWAGRFHAMYSGCGCPVPYGVMNTLKLAASGSSGPSLKFWRRKQRASTAGTQDNLANLNGSTHDESGASCPSTHNRVQIKGQRQMDIIRKVKFDNKWNDKHPNHKDPFTTYYEFVPRKVHTPGRRRRGSRDRDRERRAGIDPYWGVTPYAFYGGYAIAYPWCIPVPGGGAGVGGDNGAYGFGGDLAACATGADSAGGCATASACGASGTACVGGGGVFGDGGGAGFGGGCGGGGSCGGGGGCP